MNRIFLLLIFLLPIQIFAAALVSPTLTEIELNGIIGEEDVLEKRKYRVVAKLKDQSKLYPENSMNLEYIEAEVGGVMLEFPESFKKLKNVRLEGIGVYYVQQFGQHIEKARIEIYIPHGDFDYCKNHDTNERYYKQNKAIFSFGRSGNFIEDKTWERCKHY